MAEPYPYRAPFAGVERNVLMSAYQEHNLRKTATMLDYLTSLERFDT